MASEVLLNVAVDDVDAKKAAITAKLRSRDEERQNIVQKRNEEKLSQHPVKESVDFFFKVFQNEKKEIEEFLSTCEEQDTSELPSMFEEMSLALQKLQRYVTESTLFLPPAILRRVQVTMNDLQTDLQQKKEDILPKKRFAFKTKKKVTEKAKSPPVPQPEEKEASKFIELAVTKCNFVNKQGETLVKLADETNKADIALTNLTDCTVKLYGSPSAIHINDVKNCKIFSGPVSSAIFVRNCTGCTFVMGCHQLRIHQTTKCDFYIHVTSRAIIEGCTDVAFSPYNWEYPELDKHYELSGLDRSRNNWDDIDDFFWLSTDVHSPNWTLIPESRKIQKW